MTVEHATSTTYNSLEKQHIDTLCVAFRNNERIKSLINPRKRNRFQSLKDVVTFCYHKVGKIKGVYTSPDNESILLFYQKSLDYFSLSDIWRYLRLAFFTIGITRVKPIFEREALVKKIRNKECARHEEEDYYYAWMLAQKETKNDIAGLLDLQQFLLEHAQKQGLPIYMETTSERLVPLYERFGYAFYDSCYDVISGSTIWFGRYETESKPIDQNL